MAYNPDDEFFSRVGSDPVSNDRAATAKKLRQYEFDIEWCSSCEEWVERVCETDPDRFCYDGDCPIKFGGDSVDADEVEDLLAEIERAITELNIVED